MLNVINGGDSIDLKEYGAGPMLVKCFRQSSHHLK